MLMKGVTMVDSRSHELLVVMSKIIRLFKRYHPIHQVHPGEYMMLGAIHGCINESNNTGIEAISVGELSKKIHATKPAVSKMLNSLEEKGYIERITNQSDRRKVFITLTDNGKTIIDNASRMMYDFMESTMKKMGEEDAQALLDLMIKFYNVMSLEVETGINEKHDNMINEDFK